MARALWKSMVIPSLWVIWMKRKATISVREMEFIDLFDKEKFSASLWASTDQFFLFL